MIFFCASWKNQGNTGFRRTYVWLTNDSLLIGFISAMHHTYVCVLYKRLGFKTCSWQVAIIFCLMIHNTHLFLVLFNSMCVIMKVSKGKDSLITALLLHYFLSQCLESLGPNKTCPLTRIHQCVYIHHRVLCYACCWVIMVLFLAIWVSLIMETFFNRGSI